MSYYIASLKHTHKHHEHITFWGPDSRGYTPVAGEFIGKYDAAQAAKLNNGVDYIAIPVEVVQTVLAAEPYWKPGARFYDQRGPVVPNDKRAWDILIAGSLQDGRTHKPKPEPFKGKRRAIFTAVEIAA